MKRVIYLVVLILGLSVLGLSVNSCSCSHSSSKEVVCDRCGRSFSPDEPGAGNFRNGDVYCPECTKKWEEEQEKKWKREQRKKLGIDYW